jgi:hypothetical protein
MAPANDISTEEGPKQVESIGVWRLGDRGGIFYFTLLTVRFDSGSVDWMIDESSFTTFVREHRQIG